MKRGATAELKNPTKRKKKSKDEDNVKFDFKKLFQADKLIEKVEIADNQAKLVIKPPYNTKAYYLKINRGLLNLYKTKDAFKEYFKIPPKKSKSQPCLILEDNCSLQRGEEVLEKLKEWASPTKRINYKAKLAAGELIEKVELVNNKVSLTIKPPYNTPEGYIKINQMFNALYKSTPDFSKRFKCPARTKYQSFLLLEEKCELQTNAEVLTTLIDIASSKNQIDIRAKLAAGELIARVELVGNQATLIIKPPYNTNEHYRKINLVLYHLYKTTKAFAENFQQPTQSNCQPTLILNEDCSLQTGEQVLATIIDITSSKNQINIRKKLVDGELIERVKLEGKQATLIIKPPYNTKEYYLKINKILYSLYDKTTFAENFKKPTESSCQPILILEEGCVLQTDEEILATLINVASSKNQIDIRAKLADGELIEKVELLGKQATLIINPTYNSTEYYLKINHALKRLYRAMKDFSENFEKPIVSSRQVTLILLEDCKLQTGEDILAKLRKIAAPQKAIDIKAKLAKGKLIAKVELADNQATLIIKPPYNKEEYYWKINRALNWLYISKEAFAENFKQPIKSNSQPILVLEEGCRLQTGKDVLAKLRKIAAPQKAIDIRAKLADGKLIEKLVIADNQATLIIKPPYNTKDCYFKINRVLDHLYISKEAFAENFKRPIISNSQPILVLKEGCKLQTDEEVLSTLLEIVSSQKSTSGKNEGAEILSETEKSMEMINSGSDSETLELESLESISPPVITSHEKNQVPAPVSTKRQKRIKWFQEVLQLANVNADKGKINCNFCVFKTDDLIREGKAEDDMIPVPTFDAGLTLTDTSRFVNGQFVSIIRSHTNDERILDRCHLPKISNTTKIIYDLTLEQKEPLLDLTYEDNGAVQKQRVRLTRVDTEDDLKERLRLLPRSALDDTCFGLIVMTWQSDRKRSHLINFFVDSDNEIYFVDSQYNEIDEELDLSGYRKEIFFIQSKPKGGFKIKEEKPQEMDRITIKSELYETLQHNSADFEDTDKIQAEQDEVFLISEESLESTQGSILTPATSTSLEKMKIAYIISTKTFTPWFHLKIDAMDFSMTQNNPDHSNQSGAQFRKQRYKTK